MTLNLRKLQQAMDAKDVDAIAEALKELSEHPQPAGDNRIDRAIGETTETTEKVVEAVDAAQRDLPKPDQGG